MTGVWISDRDSPSNSVDFAASPALQGGVIPRLILASTSTARQAMLNQAGVAFSVTGSGVDEEAIRQGFSGPPAALALELAKAKALAVAAQNPQALVIGADQLLVLDGRIFTKPHDLDDAAVHLRALRGKTHRLITAACVARGGETLWQHEEEARLTMRDFSEEFLAGYLAAEADEILHCVGAYRLEGPGAQLFTRVEGDYFTILGLSLLPLLGFLRAVNALPA